MADTTIVDPLAALEAAEAAALETPTAHTGELTDAPPPPPPPETTTDAIPAETPAEPPAETPAPPAAPAETPPAEPATDIPPDQQQNAAAAAAWKRARLAEQRQKEYERELQAERERLRDLERREIELRQQLEQQQRQQEGLAEEPDQVAIMQQRLQQLEQQVAARGVDQQLADQAARFSKDHPDYPQALDAYIAQERKAAELTGEVDDIAERVLRDASPAVAELANQRNITRLEAARELAVNVIFEGRKIQLARSANRMGRTVPELIYELEQERGWKAPAAPAPGTATAVIPPPAPAATSVSAAEQIREQQRTAAENSLAAMPLSSSAPPRRVNTKADFDALDWREQDRFIQDMDAKAAKGEVPQNWHEQLS